MKAQARKGVLSRTKILLYHENNNTFSFISKSGVTICRLELNKEGIEYLGGIEALKRFRNDVQSGKRKVLVTKETLGKLNVAILMAHLQK